MVRKYEGCFLLRADLSEEALQSEIKFIEKEITAAGGQVIKQEMWGRKNLFYPIKKKTEAVYYLFYFQAEPGIVRKIEPGLRIRENVLRYLFLSRKQLPVDGSNGQS
ncbi:MAG: 30S ribosomal protein S6 [Candidatus Omnitrophica bacterium]|nr:30S ribosomal protein S6 [Candidatus Omnitrophota bacterium]